MSETYYADGRVTIWHGDCIEVLAGLPDASVDAVVCDPPYNLSDSGKRDSDCLRRVFGKVEFPHDDDGNTQRGEGNHFSVPMFGGTPLGGKGRAVRVSARVRVPERAVYLQGAAVGEEEVDGGDVAPMLAANGALSGVADAETVEDLGHYVLASADGGNSSFCDGTCSCFTEPSPGVIAVLVSLPCSPGGDLSGDPLGGGRRGDSHVGAFDGAGREPERASFVVAGSGAVRRAVLRLDLFRGTGELLSADSAGHCNPPLFRLRAVAVGALAGTGGLPPVLNPLRVGVINDAANWAFTLHVPAHGLNSTRRAGGFMGKHWDGWESPASFQRWCQAWATECLRVLKPGGHLLAFGGTRTVHRLTCGIEDAGFEIRDGIDWIYAQGFPKSLDVSKAIDRAAGAEREVIGPGRYANRGRRTDNQVYAQATPSGAEVSTAPATDDARRWTGWGTALKPAREPIVVARKPLIGTVAANVLAHGTGALHIDACRVGNEERTNRAGGASSLQRASRVEQGYRDTVTASVGESSTVTGRWPSNVALSHAATPDGVDLCVDECAPGCPVGELDAQSGVRTSGRMAAGTRRSNRDGWAGPMPTTTGAETHGDSGGASRFFPAFHYQAKAPTGERPKVDGVAHSTVKPLALMRWLVRLVTPPDGLVLDPFAGSGTTVEACVLEGFRCVAVEQDAQYLPLIEARLKRSIPEATQ